MKQAWKRGNLLTHKILVDRRWTLTPFLPVHTTIQYTQQLQTTITTNEQMEANTMLRRIIAMIISGTVLTWAIPPPPSINLTTTALASPIDLRAETWGGFYDNNCFDITYLLSDTDMNKDDKKNTIEPYLESPVLMAKCWDLMGNEKCSRLELGDCLINQNGYLRAGEG